MALARLTGARPKAGRLRPAGKRTIENRVPRESASLPALEPQPRGREGEGSTIPLPHQGDRPAISPSWARAFPGKRQRLVEPHAGDDEGEAAGQDGGLHAVLPAPCEQTVARLSRVTFGCDVTDAPLHDRNSVEATTGGDAEREIEGDEGLEGLRAP